MGERSRARGRHGMPELGAATAERLLDGGDGPRGLRTLLDAAAAPATARELPGEAAALAAFTAAQRTAAPSVPARSPSVLRTAASKIVAAKAVAAVVLLAGATGGVAVAANMTGDAGAPPADPQPSAAAPPAAPPSADPGAPDDATTLGTAPSGTTAPDAGRGAAPAPGPSLADLCTTWAARDTPGRSGDPEFRALVDAAGSAQDVERFCADPRPGGSPTGPPADGRQGTPPTAAPGNPDHPTGPRGDRPGGPPARGNDD